MTRIGGMAPNVLVYTEPLNLCWAYALWRGGAPERIGATILVVGSFLTAAAIDDGRGSFQGVEVGVVVIDICARWPSWRWRCARTGSGPCGSRHCRSGAPPAMR